MIGTILLFLTILKTINGMPCSPTMENNINQDIPELEANSIILTNDNGNTTQKTYAVMLKKSIKAGQFEVMVGVSSLANYFDDKALDFIVKKIVFSSSFNLMFSISDSAKWASVRIYYLANSRQDIFVGNFLADNDKISCQITAKKQTQKYQISSYFPKKGRKIPNIYLSSQAYLSGIRTKGRFVDISINKNRIQPDRNKITVEITVINQTDPIEQLFFGYFIYSIFNTSLRVQAISSAWEIVVENGEKAVKNSYIGILRVNTSSISTFEQKKAGRLLSYEYFQTQRMDPSLKKYVSRFEIRGFFVQTRDYQGVPILADNGYSVNSTDGCANRASCEKMSGIFISEFEDGSSARCIICRQNSSFNYQLKKCECNFGYTRNKKLDCVKIIKEDDGQMMKILSNLIDKNCGDNKFYFNGKCYDRCGVFEYFNFKQTECQCLPRSQKTIYYNKCTMCSRYALYNKMSGDCKCPEGYLGDGIFCTTNQFDYTAYQIENKMYSGQLIVSYGNT